MSYDLIDFKDGPQIIASQWLSSDKKYCAWPPWACDMDQLAYDNAVREAVKKNLKPGKDWSEEPVLRIRVKNSKFFLHFTLFSHDFS